MADPKLLLLDEQSVSLAPAAPTNYGNLKVYLGDTESGDRWSFREGGHRRRAAAVYAP